MEPLAICQQDRPVTRDIELSPVLFVRRLALQMVHAPAANTARLAWNSGGVVVALISGMVLVVSVRTRLKAKNVHVPRLLLMMCSLQTI